MADLERRHRRTYGSDSNPFRPSGFEERIIIGQRIVMGDQIIAEERIIEPDLVAGAQVNDLIADYSWTGDVLSLKRIASLCAKAGRPLPEDIAPYFTKLMDDEIEAKLSTNKARVKRAKKRTNDSLKKHSKIVRRLSPIDALRRDRKLMSRFEQYLNEPWSKKVRLKSLPEIYGELSSKFKINFDDVRRIITVQTEVLPTELNPIEIYRERLKYVDLYKKAPTTTFDSDFEN